MLSENPETMIFTAEDEPKNQARVLTTSEIDEVSGGIAFTTAAAGYALGLAAFGTGFAVGQAVWGD